MNIDNLNKLIAHLEVKPPERFNIRYIFTPVRGSQFRVGDINECGTAACIAGHCFLVMGLKVGEGVDASNAFDWLGIDGCDHADLFTPGEYFEKPERYNLVRSIATLKRLRETYLSTGQVVVDWGPEPGEKPKQAWSAPQVAEVINPALPAELTSLLRNTVEA